VRIRLERRNDEEAPRPHLQSPLAGQPETGFAHRRDAGFKLVRKVLDDYAVARAEFSGNQRLAQRRIDPRRQITLFKRLHHTLLQGVNLQVGLLADRKSPSGALPVFARYCNMCHTPGQPCKRMTYKIWVIAHKGVGPAASMDRQWCVTPNCAMGAVKWEFAGR
jgi:hypothetical protein